MEKTQSNKGIHYLYSTLSFLHFARLGISSRFLRPWFLTRPTNKLNFPACFLPKLSLHPPFLTYEGAQTFSAVRFFLREVYQRRKQVLLSLQHAERIPFSRSGYSQLPAQGSSKLSNWARVAHIFFISQICKTEQKNVQISRN